MYSVELFTPVGKLSITTTNEVVTSILFPDIFSTDSFSMQTEEEIHQLTDTQPDILKKTCLQLMEYFNGHRFEFTLPVTFQGTDFQRQIWQQLLNIPYGQTDTYLKLSQKIGNQKAIRAVGKANGSNILNIIVPCHRVIATNGNLTGYGGGLWRKEWLLNHEKKHLPQNQLSLF